MKTLYLLVIGSGLILLGFMLFVNYIFWNPIYQEKTRQSDHASTTLVPKITNVIPNKTMSKIDPVLSAWMSSNDKQDFAMKNGLVYYNNTIAAYVYLDNSSSISKIPHEIQITGIDGSLVVVRVTPEQILQLAKLTHIKNISPPALSRTD